MFVSFGDINGSSLATNSLLQKLGNSLFTVGGLSGTGVGIDAASDGVG